MLILPAVLTCMNETLLLAFTAKNSVAPAVMSVALAEYATLPSATQVSAFTATRAIDAVFESVTFALVPLVTLLYVLAGTVTYAPFLVVIVDMFFLLSYIVYLTCVGCCVLLL
jgi:hypothetical protein